MYVDSSLFYSFVYGVTCDKLISKILVYIFYFWSMDIPNILFVLKVPNSYININIMLFRMKTNIPTHINTNIWKQSHTQNTPFAILRKPYLMQYLKPIVVFKFCQIGLICGLKCVAHVQFKYLFISLFRIFINRNRNIFNIYIYINLWMLMLRSCMFV